LIDIDDAADYQSLTSLSVVRTLAGSITTPTVSPSAGTTVISGGVDAL
jgi:hypothetical protein